MKYVVTGGSGFIGSYIVKRLVADNNEVIVLDDFSRGKMENLGGIVDKITIKKADILDYESLKTTLSGIDGIFHEAALTSVPESFTNPEKYHNVNVNGTENIFKIAHKLGIKVVYASSSSVYGNTSTVPISENFEKNPINPYGVTKLDDEKLAEKYHELGGSIIGMRYFNVYGIGQTLDYAGVITKFYDFINEHQSPVVFGNGSQIRDFISVEDVADANYQAMKSNFDFGFLNIGTGIATSILELAKLMIKLSKKDLELTFGELPPGDVLKSQADTKFTKESIDWSYTTSLESGLKKFFFND